MWSVLAMGTMQAQPHFQLLPTWGTDALVLNQAGYLVEGDTLRLETFRFYLSKITLWQAGKQVWQEAESYHLIDLGEAGSERFGLEVPEGLGYDQVQFQLGIDSATQVTGAYGGDLDPLKGMFWTWQSGYINVKIEGTHPACDTRKNAFEYHLGGYRAPFPTVQTLQFPCDPESDLHFRVDLAAFFAAVDFVALPFVMSPRAETVSLMEKLAAAIVYVEED